jgi:uncharacterized membrane protein YqhA
MNIPDTLTADQSNALLWKVILHLAFIFSGLIFALMDKIAGDTVKH